jgi:hypothetical protein
LWANEQKKYQNKVNSSLNPKIAFEFAVVIAAISSAEGHKFEPTYRLHLQYNCFHFFLPRYGTGAK